MRRVLFFLLLFSTIGLSAQSITVQGEQSGVWDVDTVKVVGDVTVLDSLRIMPGTVVMFEDFYKITISNRASFFAQGVEGDSVVFTVADTTGLSVYNARRGAWNGLELRKSGSVKLDYCVLQYAKASDTLDMSGGAMNVLLADDVEISHTAFRYNFAREHGGAINAEQSSLWMTDCVVNNNKVFSDDNLYYRYGGGIRFLKCDVVMTGMEFLENDGSACVGGALSLDSCSLVLDRSVFHRNVGINGGGLYLIRSNHKYCRLSNLLFDNNVSVHFGGGFALSDVSPDVYNVTVTGNSSVGVSCNGIFFYQECSPKMTNCIIYGNYADESSSVVDTAQMWLWTFEGFGPEFRNCLIEGGTQYIHSPENLQLFEDIIDADPLFVDPEHYDYRLTEASPCRDAGWLLTPEEILAGVDLDGQPRLVNGRIDLGPYEFSSVSLSESGHVPAFAWLEGSCIGDDSRLVLRLEEAATVMVRVFSIEGRQVLVQRLGRFDSGLTAIELEGLAGNLRQGIYLMEVYANGQSCVLKMVR